MPSSPSSPHFASTHWTVVAAAGAPSSPETNAALETLCRAYWFPLYAYARRRVRTAEQAQDLTQEFFARLLEKKSLAAADRTRGRFRSFLITAFKNFLANEWEKANAKKRGGDRLVFSLDFDDGESRISHEPRNDETPEREFERQWAVTLLNRVLAMLRGEFEAADKSRRFDVLKPFLVGGGETTYAQAGAALNMSENAAKVAAHRIRKRYRELLRQEIAHTVADEREIDEEIRDLFAAVG